MFHVKHQRMNTSSKKTAKASDPASSIDAQLIYLQHLTKRSGIHLPDGSPVLFGKYMRLIIEKSARINLLSKNDLFRIAERHIFESLLLTKAADLTGTPRVLDIGAGAGFPGLPLRIWNPGIELVLIESIHKKCRFLTQTADRLGFKNVTVACGRAEELAADESLAGSFDFVTARALSTLPELLKTAAPFLRPRIGTCLFPKGSSVHDELRDAESGEWSFSLIDLSSHTKETEGPKRSLFAVSTVLTNT